MDSSVICNKKLFEKHKRNLTGFDSLQRANGIDPGGILFIPDHNVLAMAGLHDEQDRRQHLSFFQIERRFNPKSKSHLSRKSGSVLVSKRNKSEARLSLKISEVGEREELMQIEEVDSVRMIKKISKPHKADIKEGSKKSVSVGNSGDIGDFAKNKISFRDLIGSREHDLGSDLSKIFSIFLFEGVLHLLFLKLF